MEINHLLSKESSLSAYKIQDVLKVEYLKKQNQFRVFLKSFRVLDPKVKEPIGNFMRNVTGQESDTLIVNILDKLNVTVTSIEVSDESAGGIAGECLGACCWSHSWNTERGVCEMRAVSICYIDQAVVFSLHCSSDKHWVSIGATMGSRRGCGD